MTKILFLDIDGPLIPGRAYTMPGQTKPIVKVFDPCAVGMINRACEKQDRKIVVHSSWLRYPDNYGNNLVKYMVNQGINPDLFHESDPLCDGDIHWRYDRVRYWLSKHPEVTDYVILDDEPADGKGDIKNHLLLVDFEDGITIKIFHKLLDGTFKV